MFVCVIVWLIVTAPVCSLPMRSTPGLVICAISAAVMSEPMSIEVPAVNVWILTSLVEVIGLEILKTLPVKTIAPVVFWMLPPVILSVLLMISNFVVALNVVFWFTVVVPVPSFLPMMTFAKPFNFAKFAAPINMSAGGAPAVPMSTLVLALYGFNVIVALLPVKFC